MICSFLFWGVRYNRINASPLWAPPRLHSRVARTRGSPVRRASHESPFSRARVAIVSTNPQVAVRQPCLLDGDPALFEAAGKGRPHNRPYPFQGSVSRRSTEDMAPRFNLASPFNGRSFACWPDLWSTAKRRTSLRAFTKVQPLIKLGPP